MKDMYKKVAMRCSVCANDQFSAIDDKYEDLLSAPDDTEVKCSDCGRTMTKEQLIEDNRNIIDANMEDFKQEIVKELQKNLKGNLGR